MFSPAATSGNITLSVLNASDGTPRMPRPGITAWESASTVVTDVQAATPVYGGYGRTTLTFPAISGRVYKIRIADTYGDPGTYRLKVDAL